jgi:tetratricopeptide (TPR) repeat protein
LCLGIVHLEHEEPGSAIPLLERSVDLSRAGKFGHILPHAATLLAVAHARAGRGAASSGDALQAAIECDRSMTHRGLRGSRRAWLGEALANAGRLDEASSKADEALTLARADGERAGEVRALQLLAELARQRNDLQAPRIAETMYRQALAIADGLGARPLAARSEGGLAQIRA